MTQDLPDFRRPIAYAEQIALADCKGGLVHTLVGQANARYGDERNRTVFNVWRTEMRQVLNVAYVCKQILAKTLQCGVECYS